MPGSTPLVMVLLRERTWAILPVLVTLGIFFAFSGATKAYAYETCGSGLSVSVADATPAACHAPTGTAAADTTEPVGHHDRGHHHHHTTETEDSSPAVEGTLRGEAPQSAPVATALSASASAEEGSARPD